ncbi:MAG: site-2 protease family protein [Candidatus Saelkia tenebricola]|nr:site-2 protease family protein [Candidatus Saelkia tenebricola]
MKGTIKILTILGIKLEMHITFLILPIFFWFMYGMKGIFIICAIFTCVAAHELMHSVVAKNYGIKVDKIILLPIGGIANMRSNPKTPMQEFMISIAGPLFNIILALVLYFPLKIVLGSYSLSHPSLITWSGTMAYAYWINPILAGFNLLPAFPMDGGRILRSLLAIKFSYLKATKIAVGFGHLFALIFAFIALTSQPPNLILLLIALFVFMAASQEQSVASLKSTLNNIKVLDVLPENVYSVNPQTTMSDVLNQMLHSNQEDFPVVTDEGRITGFLPREKIILTVQNKELDKKVYEIMLVDFPTATSSEFLGSAYSKMESTHLKALPVIDNEGILKGIITLENVSRVYSLFARKQRK